VVTENDEDPGQAEAMAAPRKTTRRDPDRPKRKYVRRAPVSTKAARLGNGGGHESMRAVMRSLLELPQDQVEAIRKFLDLMAR